MKKKLKALLLGCLILPCLTLVGCDDKKTSSSSMNSISNSTSSSQELVEFADIVGNWELCQEEKDSHNMDLDSFALLVFTVNVNGTAELDCPDSSVVADHIPFAYNKKIENSYYFMDEDHFDFVFKYNPNSQMATFEYENFHLFYGGLYGTSSYEKVA